MMTLEEARRQNVCRVCRRPFTPGTKVVRVVQMFESADGTEPLLFGKDVYDCAHSGCLLGLQATDWRLAVLRGLDEWFVKSLPGGEWHKDEGDAATDVNQGVTPPGYGPHAELHELLRRQVMEAKLGPATALPKEFDLRTVEGVQEAIGPDAPLMAPRASGWRKVEDEYLKMFPGCAVCGTKVGCVGHHVKPVHLFPEFELDTSNLVTLCPVHHFWWGHLGSWRSYNPDVRRDVAEWREKIASRPKPPTLSDPNHVGI
jgi:5-methylcytosine-specific restriction enzyme A